VVVFYSALRLSLTMTRPTWTPHSNGQSDDTQNDG